MAIASSLPREVFVPECDSKGAFSPKQCNMWTGYCWCVDGSGNVIADTYTNGQLDCDDKGKWINLSEFTKPIK